METIKIRYIRDIEPIEKISIGDWIDLRCAEDIYIHQGDFALIPLGVAMKLPKGYEALVAPRSSTFKKLGILQTNSVGVIDNSYSGSDDEWMMPVYCPHQNSPFETIHIPKNTRICQFRIIPSQPEINFEVVENLDARNRGGFGTSGSV